jgi:hypothetical protein
VLRDVHRDVEPEIPDADDAPAEVLTRRLISGLSVLLHV